MPTSPWYMHGDPWQLTQTAPDPDRNIYFETIFCQANGYMGIRGYQEEPHTPGETCRESYLAGVFAEVNEESTKIIGDFPWPVLQMVSLPDLFRTRILLDGVEFDPREGSIEEYERSLNLRNALLVRQLTWHAPDGRTTRIKFERFLPATSPHLACLRITVTPLDWQGRIEIQHELDGDPTTYFRCGDKRQPELPHTHFESQKIQAVNDNRGLLIATTNRTNNEVAIATAVTPSNASCEAESRPGIRPGHSDAGAGEQSVGVRTSVRSAGSTAPEAGLASEASGTTALSQTFTATAKQNEPVTIARFAAVTHSRDDLGQSSPADAAEQIVDDAVARGFGTIFADHCRVWSGRWQQADVEITGNDLDQKVLRCNIFQLLQMAPFQTDRISIPARAYAFNRYRGLYFWDTEIFIAPFYEWAFPDVARNLMAFRYHTLPGARKNAEHWGGRGAMYPWMTDSETGLDNSIDARVWKIFHQIADIAYAVDEYANITGDDQFMADMGVEILVETARFFVSRFTKDADGSYHLEETIGPDEDHDPGRDNGFTCLLARRNLRLAAEWVGKLRESQPQTAAELCDKLNIKNDEIDRWRHVADHLTIPVVPGTDIPLMDEHFLGKKEADVEGWRWREAQDKWTFKPKNHGDYQVIKQADVVLAMYLLRDEFTPEQIAAAYDFYEPKTLHISSLSWNTHAMVAARLGRKDQAYEYYKNSAGLDLDNMQNATADGLHAAALGGCWQAVVLGMAGLHTANGKPACDPQLPPAWAQIRFQITHRGTAYEVTVKQDGEWTAVRCP